MLLMEICKYLYFDATSTLKVKSDFDVKKARNYLIYMLTYISIKLSERIVFVFFNIDQQLVIPNNYRFD